MCGAELTSLPEGVQRVAKVLQDKGHAHAPQMPLYISENFTVALAEQLRQGALQGAAVLRMA